MKSGPAKVFPYFLLKIVLCISANVLQNDLLAILMHDMPPYEHAWITLYKPMSACAQKDSDLVQRRLRMLLFGFNYKEFPKPTNRTRCVQSMQLLKSTIQVQR